MPPPAPAEPIQEAVVPPPAPKPEKEKKSPKAEEPKAKPKPAQEIKKTGRSGFATIIN